MKKATIIVFIINILFVVDIIVLGLMTHFIPMIKPISNFWFNPGFWYNDYSIKFLYVEIILKLLLLFIFLFLVIFKSKRIYLKINFLTLLIVYGVSFIYFYAFSDIISLHKSALLKFIVFSFSIIFLNNLYEIILFKKLTHVIIILCFIPFLFIESIHLLSRNSIDENQRNILIQTLINYKLENQQKNDSTTKIILETEALRVKRSEIYRNYLSDKITVWDKIFMYTQIDKDNPSQLDCNKLLNVICVNETNDSLYSNNINNLEKLRKVYKTLFDYIFSNPIMNFKKDKAFIFVKSIFIIEPTERYTDYNKYFLEKRNDEWNVIEIKK